MGDSIIKESGISKDIFEGGKDAENLARQENLEEFLSGMQTFVEERKEEDRADEVYLTDYLQDVALLTDLDSKGDDDAPRVSLMTVHAAKGLEFPTVFIVGLEENIFPSPIVALLEEVMEIECHGIEIETMIIARLVAMMIPMIIVRLVAMMVTPMTTALVIHLVLLLRNSSLTLSQAIALVLLNEE